MHLSLHWEVLGLAVLSQFLHHTSSATGSSVRQWMAEFVGCATDYYLCFKLSKHFPVEKEIFHCFLPSCLPSNCLCSLQP